MGWVRESGVQGGEGSLCLPLPVFVFRAVIFDLGGGGRDRIFDLGGGGWDKVSYLGKRL